MLQNIDKKFSEEYTREFSDGEIIFSEHDKTRDMYIVQHGQVLVTKKRGGHEIALATLKKGDFLGEMSLLESLPRSATARAMGATRLLVLQPGGFLIKIRRDPTFAFEMMQQLSRRIRITNERLLEAVKSEKTSTDSIRTILNHSEFQNPEGTST